MTPISEAICLGSGDTFKHVHSFVRSFVRPSVRPSVRPFVRSFIHSSYSFSVFSAWVTSLASSMMYLFVAVGTSLADRYGSRIELARPKVTVYRFTLLVALPRLQRLLCLHLTALSLLITRMKGTKGYCHHHQSLWNRAQERDCYTLSSCRRL